MYYKITTRILLNAKKAAKVKKAVERIFCVSEKKVNGIYEVALFDVEKA